MSYFPLKIVYVSHAHYYNYVFSKKNSKVYQQQHAKGIPIQYVS